MSSYETAPSTILLATHCACCDRSLRDARSVERGVGPDCAEKYGYEDAQGSANWTAVEAALEASGMASEASPVYTRAALYVGTCDAPRLTNLLTHFVAANPTYARMPDVLSAVAHAGYSKLAARLVERLTDAAAVEISEREAGTLTVVAPYNPTFVAIAKHITGRRWDRAAMVNTFPTAQRRALYDALRATFPAGTLLKIDTQAKGSTTAVL